MTMKPLKTLLRLVALTLMVSAIGLRGIAGAALMPATVDPTPAHGAAGEQRTHAPSVDLAGSSHCNDAVEDEDGPENSRTSSHDMGSSCGACGVCNAVATQEIVWTLRSDIFRGPQPTTDVPHLIGGRPDLVKPPPILSIH
jgi:hypothetical protein